MPYAGDDTVTGSELYCYEDYGGSDIDEMPFVCLAGGWLTGHPNLVTCELCIERMKIDGVRSK